MAAPAIPVTTASHVPLGHDAATGEPVDYTASTGTRVCNGLITGGIGAGKTTVVQRIADHLRGPWDVRIVDADDAHAVDLALDALHEAEQLVSRRERHDPYHLVVWDGLGRLVRDRDLEHANFVSRVTTVALHGPGYGVAQLVTTDSLLVGDFGNDTRLRAALTDNVIALPSSERIEMPIGGATIAPHMLPREHGHGLVMVGDDPEVVHVHLDGGQPPADCATCFAEATASAAAAPDVAWDPETGHLACVDERGDWRWLQYVDGAPLNRRQVRDLQQYRGLAS